MCFVFHVDNDFQHFLVVKQSSSEDEAAATRHKSSTHILNLSVAFPASIYTS